ncbi:MAG: PD-(D/E)XK nuclease family protein [Coriobacteriia bacterium]|nr:PD-(D/E)XK nuclease family protein [Coriobacteriia bacterium]
MSLHLIRTCREELLAPAALGALAGFVRADGRAALLVPSFDRALEARRLLAGVPGLGVGLECTTPAAWAESRWGVWGDGRRFADAASREVLCARVIGRAAAELSSGVIDNPGTRALLSALVERGLPWVAGAARPEGVTDAEAAVAGLAADYARELRELGLIEPCEAMTLLPVALLAADRSALVVAGFTSMPRAQREMLCALARAREVLVSVRAGELPEDERGRALADELAGCAGSLGVPVEEKAETAGADGAEGAADADGAPARAAELEALLSNLYAPRSVLDPTGAVRALLPAGPAAEPTAIADEVARAASAGAREVLVAAPDAAAAWRELSGRLVARGVSARARLSVPFASLEAGRAFLQLVEGVARLVELDASWPEPERLDRGDVRVRLADMSWWPPRDLADFAASSISGIPARRAWSLDAAWRANRLLTPAAVLEQLQNEKATSRPCALAVRELLRGRIGSAASKLLSPFVGEEGDGGPHGDGAQAPAGSGPAAEQAALEAKAVLAQALAVSKSLKECGVFFGPAEEGGVGLPELASLASYVLSRTKVSLRLRREATGAACEALIASASSPAPAPCSFDEAVLCGQTTVESPVSAADDVLHALLAAYGVEPRRPAMAAARASFAALARAARGTLVLERTLFGADSKERFASVAMSEALACYGLPADASAERVAQALGAENVVSAGETDVCRNASPAGVAAPAEGADEPAPAGRIDPSLRPCVNPPQEGTMPDEEAPLLSASQIESYLECPYKWFSLRRLRLHDADAQFSGAETGTFAHRVLEVTHRNLLARAAERAAGGDALFRIEAGDPDGMQAKAYSEEAERLVLAAQADPAARVPGSRVLADASLDEARDLLGREFDAHLAHQYQLIRGKKPLPQALVAHTAADLGHIDGLRRDLLSLLDYEAGLLVGYEPRFFEWSFGRRGQVVEYAGVRITGTVDRIDVDAHGQAAVIDYKHKGDRGFPAEYDAFGPEGAEAMFGQGGDIALPRRVQSLIYGQVVRRAFPGLKVTAAVYLCTKGAHELAGAVDAEAVDAVFGEAGLGRGRAARLEVPRSLDLGRGGEGAPRGMGALLDACEEAIAAKLERMRAGDIEARPIDDHACQYCPVLNCEKRRCK